MYEGYEILTSITTYPCRPSTPRLYLAAVVFLHGCEIKSGRGRPAWVQGHTSQPLIIAGAWSLEIKLNVAICPHNVWLDLLGHICNGY